MRIDDLVESRASTEAMMASGCSSVWAKVRRPRKHYGGIPLRNFVGRLVEADRNRVRAEERLGDSLMKIDAMLNWSMARAVSEHFVADLDYAA